MLEIIKQRLQESVQTKQKIVESPELQQTIFQIVEASVKAFKEDKKLLGHSLV